MKVKHFAQGKRWCYKTKTRRLCKYAPTSGGTNEHNVSASRRRTVKALREIRKYQISPKLLIQKESFASLVRHIAQGINHEFEISDKGILCIQHVAEDYLASLFKDTNLCAIHANRVTITVDDLKLSLCIRNEVYLLCHWFAYGNNSLSLCLSFFFCLCMTETTLTDRNKVSCTF